MFKVTIINGSEQRYARINIMLLFLKSDFIYEEDNVHFQAPSILNVDLKYLTHR